MLTAAIVLGRAMMEKFAKPVTKQKQILINALPTMKVPQDVTASNLLIIKTQKQNNMKKTIYLLIALFGLGFTSCKKCVDCTGCAFGAGGEICQDDYDTKDEYDDAVEAAENVAGCDCK